MVYKRFDASELNKLKNSPEYRKAYAGHTTTASQGGETIPTDLASYFIDLQHDTTWVRQVFKTAKMDHDTLEIAKLTSGNTAYMHNEGTDATTENGADGATGSNYSRTGWGSVNLTVDKINVLTGYTTELQEESLINVAQMTIENGAIAMAEAEESAFIKGHKVTSGAGIGALYTAGQPEQNYNGLIPNVPWNANSGVVQVSAAGWTSLNTSSGDNIIDGAQSLLTFDMLNNLLATIEDKTGSGKVDTIVLPPKLLARMRNPVEFEMFQSLDKIGSQAALIKSQVGSFYGSRIISSGFIPRGSDTSPGNMDDASNGIVQNSTDTLVLGFDSRVAQIGQRREMELLTRHKFYNDVAEVRFIERVGFEVIYPQWLGMIGDVKNSAVI